MQKVFSIFAQNLAYYNEGSIEGGWLDLPQSPEVIDKYLKEVVKVDDEHEEYEIADIDDNISPFPYASIQWSSVKELNELAIIFSKLDECQREAIQAYLVYSGEEHYSISQLVNICLQADNINYCRYSFEGLEYNQDCSPELKMGYTMAEENGIYIQLQKLDQLMVICPSVVQSHHLLCREREEKRIRDIEAEDSWTRFLPSSQSLI